MYKLQPSDFGTMQPFRLILRMIIPSILSMVVLSLCSMVEGIILGRFGGGFPLAIERIGMPVFSIMVALATVVGVGSSTQVSLKLGQGETSDASRIFTKSTVLLLIAGFLLGGFVLLFGDEIMALFGAGSDAIPLAYEFLVPLSILCPFVLLSITCDYFLRACGRPLWGFVTYLCYIAINLGLDSVFVICFNMGATGVAIASAVAALVSAIIGYLPFLRHKVELKFEWGKIPLRTYGRIFYNGLPTLTTTLTFTIISIFVNFLLIKIGGTPAVAIYAVILSIMPIACVAALGTADGVQQVISYCYGKNDWKRIYTIANMSLLFAAILSIIAFIILILFGDTFVEMFLKSDEIILIHYTSTALFLFSFVCLTRWISIFVTTFFISIQKATISLILNLIETFVLPAICIFSLIYVFGFYGIWAAFPIASLITAIIAAILYFIIGKKHKIAFLLNLKNNSNVEKN